MRPRDAEYMDRALTLAARARGCTTPNPLVGAVVVSHDGVVVGAGCHARAGEPHAEVHALRAAGKAARGATLYCTLEPCCHTGRTPPCVDAILEAGIARVVIAVDDPNPQVAGGGRRRLQERGVQVHTGVGRDQAVRLNQPFFCAMLRQRPFVTAKIATSLDGRVASGPGARTHMTGAAADRRSQLLRAEVDAVGVGSGTVLADDPLLTARDVYRGRPLTRVVFDRRLRTPVTARLFGTLSSGPVLIVTTTAMADARSSRVRDLERAGATLVRVQTASIGAAVAALLPFSVQSLLVEGGTTLHEAALADDVVDAVRVVVTPSALGPSGLPWVGWSRLSISSLFNLRVRPCGADVIMEGDVHRFD
ncbi:MAG: bifunctional diaminohydroxyphosphoribosylaminopyrimidine deaminase/5-amino-6-(5-phosphoribosylamino)uracil reductase RibD [Acidobacteria bacterium]|nr:bifunctional diaminohydroxyphosphoribosylaminopyrimidine deaminase/5-amino-6-(5-phosphoribosylamino)uracil reductase RibD [Acidobacteriota bacterium]